MSRKHLCYSSRGHIYIRLPSINIASASYGFVLTAVESLSSIYKENLNSYLKELISTDRIKQDFYALSTLWTLSLAHEWNMWNNYFFQEEIYSFF